MSPELILPLTLVFAALLIIGLLTPRVLKDTSQRVKKGKSFEKSCPTCQKIMTVPRNKIRPLRNVETALVVQIEPNLEQRLMGEFRCPHCESAHIFLLDTTPPHLVISDPGEPQTNTNQCTNCHKPLLKATWPRNEYEGRVLEAPDLQPKHGLICARCDAVCCVECVKDATRNRTKDGSLLCPRCHRAPVDKIYTF
ncbi:MAG: hypothetical protein COA73_10450 [Candidatus Hydrogenedentota bacterium]|nr:MAG: hypothetical protein COA73_10450 [Candidatus Hydrogenedentota bacterium]